MRWAGVCPAHRRVSRARPRAAPGDLDGGPGPLWVLRFQVSPVELAHRNGTWTCGRAAPLSHRRGNDRYPSVRVASSLRWSADARVGCVHTWYVALGYTKVSVTPESSAQIHLDHTRNRGVRDFLARLSRQFLPAQVAKGVGAPPMIQCMPDCLSRWPMTVVQPTGLRSRTAAAT